MGRIEKSIEILASPERIWELLAFDRFPEWMDMMIRVDYTSEGNTPQDKYRVGATALGTPEEGPENNCHYDITESLEHEKLTFRMWEKWLGGTLGGPVTMTLKPVDGGTEATLEGTVEMPWRILKIIEPLILRMGRKEFEKSLANLKTILEQ